MAGGRMGEFIRLADEKLQAMIDPDYQEKIKVFVPGQANVMGVRVPDLRKLAKELYKEYRDITMDELFELMDDALVPEVKREHFMLTVFVLSEIKNFSRDEKLWREINKWGDCLIDWEMTDQLGGVIVGECVAEDLSKSETLMQWTKSDHVWKRRLALIATISCNKKKRKNAEIAIDISRELMEDEHPMIYKAVGFALREACRAGGEKEVFDFLLSVKDKACPKTITESMKKLSEKEQAILTGK